MVALKREPEAAPVGEPGADREFLERAWRSLSRWAVPVMMAGAYTLLAITSDTDTTGKAWMAVGFLFVLVVWFLFRALTETAALSRALAVGDVARLFELADRHLARKRRPADRAPFVIARALGFLLRGQFADVLAAVSEVRPAPELVPLAEAVRLAALIELGTPVEPSEQAAVAPVQGARQPAALIWLGAALAAFRGGELEPAAQQLARVIDDVRAGGAARAIAHVYAARIADTRGDAAAAARHRDAAAALASPGASWLRDQGAAAGLPGS